MDFPCFFCGGVDSWRFPEYNVDKNRSHIDEGSERSNWSKKKMLNKEELRYLDSLPAAICMLDKKGKITHWNRCISRWTGVNGTDAKGQEISDFLPDLDQKKLHSYLSRLEGGEEQIDFEWSCSQNLKQQTNANILFKLSSSPLGGFIILGTEVNCYVEKLRDCGKVLSETRDLLDDVSRSKSSLARSQKKLKALNSELYSIGYTLSHDLRAPLRHIDGYSGIMKDMLQEGDLDGCSAFLERIQSSVAKMGDLLDSVLRLSRVMGAELLLVETDLTAIFRDVWREMDLTEELEDYEFKIPSGFLVEADPGLLRLMAENLLNNAVKYTKEGRKPQIELGRNMVDGKEIFYLKDNGIGFSQDVAEEIFLPFHRNCNDKRIEGNGIGLTIISKVMDRHGGCVWAEGIPDEGAAIYFSFDPDVIR